MTEKRFSTHFCHNFCVFFLAIIALNHLNDDIWNLLFSIHLCKYNNEPAAYLAQQYFMLERWPASGQLQSHIPKVQQSHRAKRTANNCVQIILWLSEHHRNIRHGMRASILSQSTNWRLINNYSKQPIYKGKSGQVIGQVMTTSQTNLTWRIYKDIFVFNLDTSHVVNHAF